MARLWHCVKNVNDVNIRTSETCSVCLLAFNYTTIRTKVHSQGSSRVYGTPTLPHRALNAILNKINNIHSKYRVIDKYCCKPEFPGHDYWYYRCCLRNLRNKFAKSWKPDSVKLWVDFLVSCSSIITALRLVKYSGSVSEFLTSPSPVAGCRVSLFLPCVIEENETHKSKLFCACHPTA